MKSERRGLSLFVVTLILLVSAVLGGVYGPSVGAAASSADDYQTAVKQFTRVLDVVQSNYADPVDVDKEVYQGAIPGMLRVLDPHSNFFDDRQLALLREDQRGRYYGVGMIVAPRENHTVVMAPYVGAPAYNAGLRPGDIIVKVDDKATDGLTTSEVADMLKGQKGTIVKIVVTREGYPDPVTFTVTRGEIPRHSVDIAFLIKPNIGYIRLSAFNETTDHEIAESLKELNVSNLDGLVLDMRGNPGGLLNEAVAVSDMFLERGQIIVSHRGRASQNHNYTVVRGNQGMTVPLVILVNNNSASATEIVSPAEAGVGRFPRAYLGERPTITHDFSVDDNVMHEFRNYLSKHNVRYAEADLAENQDWVKRKIKQEVFMSTFGMQDGFKVLLEADPQVQKAVESIPDARALYQTARKIVAQRNGGALDQP